MLQIHTTLKRNSDSPGIKPQYSLSSVNSFIFLAGEHQHWELSSEETALLSESGIWALSDHLTSI